VPHDEELVLGDDRAEHMQATVAARLDECIEPCLPQHGPQLVRGDDRVRDPGPRLRVEVDAQLDGVVCVV
ncbi:hypothetical protein ABE10_01735, partial [Bacillus toyonensis]|nr:hypothetical protein [Bacillus toyonensis]